VTVHSIDFAFVGAAAAFARRDFSPRSGAAPAAKRPKRRLRSGAAAWRRQGDAAGRVGVMTSASPQIRSGRGFLDKKLILEVL
jgi:hypothetical protein